MAHKSLRPHVESVQELYDLLDLHQEQTERRMLTAVWVVLGCLVVALAATGPIAKVALCMAVLVGMTWVWNMANQVCRGWFMHFLTLNTLIRPPDVLSEVLVDALLADRAQEGAGESREEATGPEVGPGQA